MNMELKKRIGLTIAILPLLASVSCSQGKDAKAAESEITVTETVEATTEEAPAVDVEADKALVSSLYEKCVLLPFGKRADEAYAKDVCSDECVKKLVAANEFEDGSLAFWALRTDAQDGDGDSKVTAIEPMGDGWYKVSYLDQGFKGETRVLVKDGKICDYERISQAF